MPSSSPSLRERYAEDLRSGSLAVSLTAILLAVPAGLGFAWYVEDFEGGFLLLMLIGVFVPMAHETHWPQDQGWLGEVAWTVGATLVAAWLFGVGYVAARIVVDDRLVVAVAAFLFALVVGGVLARRFGRVLGS